MTEQKKSEGTLIIKSKSEFYLDGVNNVLSFDEYAVLLDTDLGEVTVEGSEMKIEKLGGDCSEIVIKGNITGVFYSTKKETRGFFKGLFK